MFDFISLFTSAILEIDLFSYLIGAFMFLGVFVLLRYLILYNR